MRSFADVMPPDRIGAYEILDRLGAGGMAEVLLAIRHGAGGFAKPVAIKRIQPVYAQHESFRTMMLREAALAAMLDHRHCVDVSELADPDGELIIAMELLYGADAAELSTMAREAGSPLSIDVIVKIIGDAARGLHHAHQLSDAEGVLLGVVHRDVSPHNLFVTDDGITKVLDFGIATAFEVMESETRTGALKGKARYMAPEQAELQPLDARADVWALAVSLWEMVMGRPMFPGSLAEVLDAIRYRQLEMPHELGADVPAGLDDVLRQAFQRPLDKRHGSARELANALESVVPPAPSSVVAALVARHKGKAIKRLRTRVKKALRAAERLGAAMTPSNRPPEVDARALTDAAPDTEPEATRPGKRRTNSDLPPTASGAVRSSRSTPPVEEQSVPATLSAIPSITPPSKPKGRWKEDTVFFVVGLLVGTVVVALVWGF